MSSPPARGSSGGWVVLDGTLVVVPARAGVVQRPSLGRRLRDGRPRPRGGRPAPVMLPDCPTPSSPPARGSSDSLADLGTEVGVVPARAGVVHYP